jgi:hypothetical protein
MPLGSKRAAVSGHTFPLAALAFHNCQSSVAADCRTSLPMAVALAGHTFPKLLAALAD